MPDVRVTETLKALRTRLATVAGLPTVLYAGQEDDKEISVAHVVESVVFGTAIDTGKGGGRWREASGSYQLMVCYPESAGVLAPAAMASAIEAAYLTSEVTSLPSGYPILVYETTIQPVRQEVGWLKVPLVLMFRLHYTL